MNLILQASKLGISRPLEYFHSRAQLLFDFSSVFHFVNKLAHRLVKGIMLALAQLRAITNFEATHASLVGLDFETATFTAAGFLRFVVFPQQLDGVRLAFFGSAGEPELSSHEAVSP